MIILNFFLFYFPASEIVLFVFCPVLLDFEQEFRFHKSTPHAAGYVEVFHQIQIRSLSELLGQFLFRVFHVVVNYYQMTNVLFAHFPLSVQKMDRSHYHPSFPVHHYSQRVSFLQPY